MTYSKKLVPTDMALFIRVVSQRCRSRSNILPSNGLYVSLVVARLYVHTRAVERGTIRERRKIGDASAAGSN